MCATHGVGGERRAQEQFPAASLLGEDHRPEIDFHTQALVRCLSDDWQEIFPGERRILELRENARIE
jgi:hypothetical protein